MILRDTRNIFWVEIVVVAPVGNVLDCQVLLSGNQEIPHLLDPVVDKFLHLYLLLLYFRYLLFKSLVQVSKGTGKFIGLTLQS